MQYLCRAVAVALFASLVTFAPAPANAVTTVETSAENASILGDACDTTYVHVDGDWETDYANEIAVDVYGPNGGHQTGNWFTDEYSGHVTVPVKLCADDAAGTYQIEVEATGYDESGVSTGTVNATGTFEFIKKPKRKSDIRGEVNYKPRLRYAYQVPARLLRAGRGYEGKRVYLVVRSEGSWWEMDSMRTKNRGKFGWNFKPNRYTWGYLFLGDKTTKSVAVTFTTPRRDGRAARGQVAATPVEITTVRSDELGGARSSGAPGRLVSRHP